MFQMQPTKLPLKLCVATAAASLLLAGCGGSETPVPTTPDSSATQSEPTTEPTTSPTAEPTTESAPDPTQGEGPESQWNVQTSVATYVARDDGGVDSLLEGNLMLLDSGCLVVREKSGENAFIPVFPISHEAVEFDGVTLRLGAEMFHVGDKISLNGLPLEWADEYPELDYTIPPACKDLDTWWASPQNM